MTSKTTFFEGWPWFKFNNLGLALGTNLKFYTSLSKGLKLKLRKFWGVIPTFVEVAGETLVGGAFLPPPSHPILNRVKGKLNLMQMYDPLNISHIPPNIAKHFFQWFISIYFTNNMVYVTLDRNILLSIIAKFPLF